MSRCAKRGCTREATEAHDVGSWFKPSGQDLRHYEVCELHGRYFAGSFDRQQSEAVKRDLIPWSPVVARSGVSPQPEEKGT